jgi:pectin methylesterase-like acyl-CoA thioesterase
MFLSPSAVPNTRQSLPGISNEVDGK